MADPITADCHTDYKAFHSSGLRSLSAIQWVVMHSTEVQATAKEVAHSFSLKTAEGSAHLVVDDDSCYRCLTNAQIPWAAPSANVKGFHIEQCGFAAWTAADWEKHLPMLHRGAYKAAWHLNLFKLPAVWVPAAGLKAGHKGITTHAEVSLAFPNSQGNHHDPGTGWPRALFVSLVRHYLETLTSL